MNQINRDLRLVYCHQPFFSLFCELLLVVYISNKILEIYTTQAEHFIFGILCYSAFLIVVLIFVYFTDFTRVHINQDCSLIVQRRPFPFVRTIKDEVGCDAFVRVGRKSAGRDSLVRLCIVSHNLSIYLTRARVLKYEKAAEIASTLNSEIGNKGAQM